MFEINNQTVLIIIALIILLFSLFRSDMGNMESFDQYGLEFLPVGKPRYGLRGDNLRTSSIANYYLSPYRNIRLSQTGEMMYESNVSPTEEGVSGCKKVACPSNVDEYDSMDTCWQCYGKQRKYTRIPYV